MVQALLQVWIKRIIDCCALRSQLVHNLCDRKEPVLEQVAKGVGCLLCFLFAAQGYELQGLLQNII